MLDRGYGCPEVFVAPSAPSIRHGPAIALRSRGPLPVDFIRELLWVFRFVAAWHLSCASTDRLLLHICTDVACLIRTSSCFSRFLGNGGILFLLLYHFPFAECACEQGLLVFVFSTIFYARAVPSYPRSYFYDALHIYARFQSNSNHKANRIK